MAALRVRGPFQLRHDSAANWTSKNPTLLVGEVAVDEDAKMFKIGDGVTAWNDLPYCCPVMSVFGRVGHITGQSGDYSFDQIIGVLDGGGF